MKTLGSLLVILLLAATAGAQTVVQTDHLGWDQTAPALADATRYAYTPTVDGAAKPALVNVACTGSASPFACVGDYPALTPGSHSLTLTATDGTLASTPSLPFGFVFAINPAQPQNLRNIRR